MEHTMEGTGSTLMFAISRIGHGGAMQSRGLLTILTADFSPRSWPWINGNLLEFPEQAESYFR